MKQHYNNKNTHHDKYFETNEEEREKLCNLVPWKAFFSCFLEQEVQYFTFALCPTNYAVGTACNKIWRLKYIVIKYVYSSNTLFNIQKMLVVVFHNIKKLLKYTIISICRKFMWKMKLSLFGVLEREENFIKVIKNTHEKNKH